MYQSNITTDIAFATIPEGEAKAQLAQNTALALSPVSVPGDLVTAMERQLARQWFRDADDHFDAVCIAAGFNPSQIRDRMLGLFTQAEKAPAGLPAHVISALQAFQNEGNKRA